MLRIGLFSSMVFPPSHEESGDEDLAVLPRYTKVVVTGNNRTKSELVGLRGVVKNAVGHGGWHWLVLESGAELKLQRNALTVVEPPNGNVEENDLPSGSDVQGKASLRSSSIIQYEKRKTSAAKHKKPSTPASTKSVKSASLNSLMGIQSNEPAPQMKLNFSNLSTRSLLRYWRRFNLGNCSPNITKNQLIYAVQRHFFSQKVDEEKAIVEFIRSAKRVKAEGAKA